VLCDDGEIAVLLRLIGPMDMRTVKNESVLPASRKARALLAVLALSGRTPVSRRRLAELLWSQRDENTALASLCQELEMLVTALAPAKRQALLISPDHLALDFTAVRIDVEEAMTATADEPDQLSMWDRDLLECLDGIDPSFDMWLTRIRQELRDRVQSVAEAALRAQIEPGSVMIAAKCLLRIDCAHEAAWRSLIGAYEKNGERGLAMQAYDLRRSLEGLGGISPSEETQRLLNEIRGAPLPRRDN